MSNVLMVRRQKGFTKHKKYQTEKGPTTHEISTDNTEAAAVNEFLWTTTRMVGRR